MQNEGETQSLLYFICSQCLQSTTRIQLSHAFYPIWIVLKMESKKLPHIRNGILYSFSV
jgi:hypothetical protein